MHRTLRTPFIALIVLLAQCPASAESQATPEVVFNGRITDEKVDAFIAANEAHLPGAHVLSLSSSGGEVLAAIKLARWVRKNDLDVRVRLMCMSSCANYVFPAGRKKIIDPHALVVWHGSAEQKNFREAQARYDELLAAQQTRELSADERLLLESGRQNYDAMIRYRAAQRDFFAEIGVDEGITRLGQEPVDYHVYGWTASLKAMARFGIEGVSASPDYGSLAELTENPAAIFLLHGHLLTFDTDPDGALVAQEARDVKVKPKK